VSCSDPRRWQPKIALEAGGDLPPEERAAVSAHREACPDCRALARELAADREILASLTAEELRPEALDRVRRAVMVAVQEEGADRAHSGALRGRRLRFALPALAAALFALAIGLALWLPHPVPRSPSLGPAGESPATGGDERAPQPAEAPPAEPRAPSLTETPSLTGTPSLAAGAGPSPDRGTAPTPSDRLAAAGPISEHAPDRAQPSRHEPSPALDAVPTAGEPAIMIQIVSEDPDIVFYWLTDQPQEEPDDATV